ncbi:hypothetical protein [Streptomyces sp. NPDC056264]|uniref:hypothetical protein n=1 Tax=Streptomyces sp. NPDC056264 TaxID=3345767 RepID=UPI003AAFDBA3
MGKRLERKMLRLMAGGRPVALDAGSASFKRLARLAFLAEQFGYEYADLRRKERSFILHLEPDLRPRAWELAAENRRTYPRAAEGGPLPVPDAGTIALFRARMMSDLKRTTSLLEALAYTGVAFIISAVGIGFEFGDDRATALTIAGVVVAAEAVFVTALILWGRRANRRAAALLEAAGFTRVPDENGRLRHVPPGDEGRTAGHGNPFAGGGSR